MQQGAPFSDVVEAGELGHLFQLQTSLHHLQRAAGPQREDEHARDDGAHDGGDEEGYDVGRDGQGGGVALHEEHGHRPGAESAEDAGAEHLGYERDEDGGDVVPAAQGPVGEAAAERAYHAAGEGHERPRAD